MRLNRPTTLALLVMLGPLLSPNPGGAQHQLEAGSRYRLTTQDGRIIVGTVSGVTTEQLTIVESRAQGSGSSDIAYTLPLAELASLERSLGKTRRFGKYFGISVLAGGALGLFLGASTWEPCEGSCFFQPETREDAAVVGLAGGVLLGAVLGLPVGLFNKEEQWAPVTMGVGGVSLIPMLGPRVGVITSISLTRRQR